ncbi:hypothetical protein UFOVP26_116 [uncultured Caudovirales phage]|uniref:Uncharacterized protein n=1 Tax=uncultured Caudovirales phage TaxID=2100421 RepID=A0A6J5KUW2_9CAUD|nr:hypothetical protein UFOVP26_116 [uncultured Caudovirales phage]CAB4124000.1 hypothetical protein UFOVP44_119 [uncultured Caudovirales phage]CAB5219621.1 hypothetical protein UFOVP220_110 [uncultured Caudovirales phage]
MAAKDAGKLIGILFLARDMSHRAHLATTSYAQHVALGDFYDAITDLADGFTESYQGEFGQRIVIPYMDAKDFDSDIVNALEQQRVLISSMRASVVGNNQALSNLYDGILNQYQRTAFLLSLK